MQISSSNSSGSQPQSLPLEMYKLIPPGRQLSNNLLVFFDSYLQASAPKQGDFLFIPP